MAQGPLGTTWPESDVRGPLEPCKQDSTGDWDILCIGLCACIFEPLQKRSPAAALTAALGQAHQPGNLVQRLLVGHGAVCARLVALPHQSWHIPSPLLDMPACEHWVIGGRGHTCASKCRCIAQHMPAACLGVCACCCLFCWCHPSQAYLSRQLKAMLVLPPSNHLMSTLPFRTSRFSLWCCSRHCMPAVPLAFSALQACCHCIKSHLLLPVKASCDLCPEACWICDALLIHVVVVCLALQQGVLVACGHRMVRMWVWSNLCRCSHHLQRTGVVSLRPVLQARAAGNQSCLAVHAPSRRLLRHDAALLGRKNGSSQVVRAGAQVSARPSAAPGCDGLRDYT